MTEALDRCVEDGVKEIVVQPTHLMGGLEYTDVKDELDKYADKFDKILARRPAAHLRRRLQEGGRSH